MNNEYREIRLADLGKHYPNLINDDLAQNLYISGRCRGGNLDILKYPSKFDCYIAFYCIKGHFKVNVNLKEFKITDGTLLFYVPGCIICMDKDVDLSGCEFVLIAISRDILQNAKVNFSRLYEEAMRVMAKPCISLNSEQQNICGHYYRLTEALIQTKSKNIKESVIDLYSSLSHYLGSLWIDNAFAKNDSPDSLRSKSCFEKFMKLLAEHHNDEREVSFYAGELNLTPKYLSQLIKKTSGKSAPEWIASFVILEAKNYLKYSDLDVKEISYRLKFSSTPVFFRYFKSHTGMTPLEYRKS